MKAVLLDRCDGVVCWRHIFGRPRLRLDPPNQETFYLD
jgi:hypothetical protein